MAGRPCRNDVLHPAHVNRGLSPRARHRQHGGQGSRIGAVLFAVFYGAFEVLVGIGTGILVNDVNGLAAGERAADFLTLVTSAVRNDLDVWAYVKDVLDRLLAGSTDYEPLRPDIWKQSHPEAVRQYRTQHRRDRADRKQLRRARRRQAAH